ncbi:hypothetical protein MPC4_40077 [Methylocella tundrae]|uniref:Uncharacterized protein n=1 Tax=Methylocella tundrae TaxID=227605 RepID=A0A8B6MB24_METTU|nr:hypothetical protein MPC1_7170003 [Methylocella tundrae]VTZ51479.1 hypothetical protein MPC4_40077 [Methylocella tundrae]
MRAGQRLQSRAIVNEPRNNPVSSKGATDALAARLGAVFLHALGTPGAALIVRLPRSEALSCRWSG